MMHGTVGDEQELPSQRNLCRERCPRRTRSLTIQPMSLQRWSHKSMSDSRSIASRIRFATRTRIFLAGLRANCYCSF